jgi:tripartite-type tricarboxylate transporter receptor subunit TctC
MMIERRGFLSLVAGVAALPASTRMAQAQSYPARSVRILVATTAGGATDLAARLVAQWLTDRLGQSFFVENRPGGNNNIGTEAAARAPADGYTLFMANSVNTINASLYQKLSYDFIADFIPIVRIVRSPLLMMAHPSVAAKTVPEFIALAKANPGKITIVSGGHGSTGHMAGQLFMMETGTKMVHLPYRGESLAMTDLIGGQVQVAFATTGSAISYAKAGTVRTLAVTTQTPFDGLPDVPPLATILPGFEVSGWSGMCAPKNTPSETVALLNKEINAAIADPKFRQRVADLGGSSPGGSSAEFARFLAEETERWRKVVNFAGIKVE